MRIERSALASALRIVSGGLASTEEYNSFIFTEGRVFTYNSEVAVSVPVKVDFEGAVPAKEFQALVNKVKTAELNLTVKSGELLLTGSKAKAGLRISSDFTLPLQELGMPAKWVNLPEKFCKAVQFCLFSASNDDNKAVLKNIHIFDQYVESCDNMRVTQYNMGEEAAKSFTSELLIPATAAKDIISNNPIEYGITEGWLHFRNKEDVTFSCRNFDFEYPNFVAFLECEGDDIDFPATLPEVLDRASVLGEGDRITIILENNELIVATENVNGWFEESIDIAYKGKPAEFDINPEFFKSIMKFSAYTAILGERAIRFTGDSFVHVTLILQPKKK